MVFANGGYVSAGESSIIEEFPEVVSNVYRKARGYVLLYLYIVLLLLPAVIPYLEGTDQGEG